MVEEQKVIKVNLDPILYTITNVNIGFSEEEFIFTIFSGNQARRFSATPKHAKRISLLLEKRIDEYEKKFGKVETQLPERMGTEREKPIGFAR